MIERIDVSITTTGGAGSSTGNATTSEILNGILVGVYLGVGSAPNTTDWVFTDPVTGDVLFTLTNYNTAGWAAPLAPAVTAAAGAAITDVGVGIPVVGRIKCAIAGSNDGTYTVRYYLQR